MEAGETARIIFDACDADRDGLVSRADIETTLRRLGGRHEGSRALFATYDGDGDGALRYEEFVQAVLAVQSHPASATVEPTSIGLSESAYFCKHMLAPFFVQMAWAVDHDAPEDPYLWMMQYLAKYRAKRAQARAYEDATLCTSSATTKPSTLESTPPSSKMPLSLGPKHGKAPSSAIRVNTSAVLRKTPKKLLDLVLSTPGWQAVEDASDIACHIYFTWDERAFLQRLGHPSCPIGCESMVPRLPTQAWINRMPGMGHLCDKVNMALALRLLQKLWPHKFRFWPKSWLLPNERDKLMSWLQRQARSDAGTVIVKPSDGSLGEGIFLAQSASDLESKLMARPNWGAGFCALAQRYLPDPLLIGNLKFDLRLYLIVTSVDPLCAYLCKEGLARFCTTKYERPTAVNANQHYMHLTNFSLNKKSAGFVRATDPLDVESRASKRPLTTLLRQIEMQEAAAGRLFDEAQFYKACEEVVVGLLHAVAPVLNVTYQRVAKEAQPKAKAKPKAKARFGRKKKNESDDDEKEESVDSDDSLEEYAPKCFQMLGVDVLLDSKMQPWLLEINGRPSMDIEEPVRLEEAPPGTRRCACRDMDGEEHAHFPSPVDVLVKTTAMRGAFEIVSGHHIPQQYIQLDFAEHGPGCEVSDLLQLVARLYQVAGGAEKAFTTYGVRKALANAIKGGLNPHDVDAAVSRWKHQGYRKSGDLEKDTADIGILDFAELLQEVAMLGKNAEDDDPLEALTSLVEGCDPD